MRGQQTQSRTWVVKLKIKPNFTNILYAHGIKRKNEEMYYRLGLHATSKQLTRANCIR